MSDVMWVDFVLPIVMGVAGWFGNGYRNKQKKEGDILANVERIVSIQDAHIKKAEETLNRAEKINQRLEAKLDRKRKAVRAANKCKYTNEGDGCPVLSQEEQNERIYDDVCEKCEYHNADER